MKFRTLTVLLTLAVPAGTAAQSAGDSLAVIRGIATALTSEPGGPFLVGGEGELTDALATSLNTRRARAGELPNCGGLVGRIGVAPISQSGGYVLVIKAPEFSGDEAVVRLGLRCMNTMGGRLGSFTKNEVLVFRRAANGWALARRSRS